MNEQIENDELKLQATDYVTSAAKSILGIVPFAGSLLAELAGTLIPNQRIDRLTKFAEALETKLKKIEECYVRAQLTNEYFTDLLEEGLRQAARSVSDERREYIASVIANSLSSEDIEYIESSHILKMLGEINDLEIIWLRSYLVRTMGGDIDYIERHQNVLKPIAAYMGAEQKVLDKSTLQNSYKDHLSRLGLLKPKYKIDSKTRLPEFDSSGLMKVSGYDLTSLGRFLLRQTGLTAGVAE